MLSNCFDGSKLHLYSTYLIQILFYLYGVVAVCCFNSLQSFPRISACFQLKFLFCSTLAILHSRTSSPFSVYSRLPYRFYLSAFTHTHHMSKPVQLHLLNFLLTGAIVLHFLCCFSALCCQSLSTIFFRTCNFVFHFFPLVFVFLVVLLTLLVQVFSPKLLIKFPPLYIPYSHFSCIEFLILPRLCTNTIPVCSIVLFLLFPIIPLVFILFLFSIFILFA